MLTIIHILTRRVAMNEKRNDKLDHRTTDPLSLSDVAQNVKKKHNFIIVGHLWSESIYWDYPPTNMVIIFKWVFKWL